MADVFGSIDYTRLKSALGKANFGVRIVVDLSIARTGFPSPASLVYPIPPLTNTGGIRIEILDVGTGTFTLTLVFIDGSTLNFANTEILTDDVFEYDFVYLFITNTVQAGKTLELLVDDTIIS